MPAQFIVIVSYADVCTDFAKRVSLLNNTDILRGQWAVSLLRESHIEGVLNRLHEKRDSLYTNCYIEEWFQSGVTHSFIYSFVCDQDLLEQVLNNKHYTLILPEALFDQIDTSRLNGTVYIDRGV